MSIIWISLGGKQRTKHTNILSRVCFAMQHMLMMLQITSKRWLQTQMGQDLLLINKIESGETNGLFSPMGICDKVLIRWWQHIFLHFDWWKCWSYIGKTPHYLCLVLKWRWQKEPHCKFVWLLLVENVKVDGIYNSINEFILESNLDFKKLVYRYLSCLCFGLKNINAIFILCISLSLWGSYVYLCTFYSDKMYSNEASYRAFHC